MYKVTLEINSSIYEHIMFFLENLPKNLVNIKQEIEYKTKKTTKQSTVSKMKNLQGVGKSLYLNNFQLYRRKNCKFLFIY